MRSVLPLLRSVLLVAALTVPVLASASAVLAQSQDEALYEDADGRLRGYEGATVIMPDESTALTYMALIALAILTIGVMFKTSGRTHLD